MVGHFNQIHNLQSLPGYVRRMNCPCLSHHFRLRAFDAVFFIFAPQLVFVCHVRTHIQMVFHFRVRAHARVCPNWLSNSLARCVSVHELQ